MISALFLLATAAATSPVPGEVRVFKDWYVACDNVRSCEAGTLAAVDGDLTGAMAVQVYREGGPDARFHIKLQPSEDVASGPARLKIDRNSALSGTHGTEGSTLLTGAEPLAIARMLANGGKAVMIVSDGATVSLSLAGSSAALRYMDSVQQRDGTTGAIIAAGTKPDTARPPSAPQIIARSASRLIELPDMKDYPEIITETGCEFRMEGVGDTVYPLGQRNGKDMALALIACDSGAYNFGSVAMIAERPMEDPNARWTFSPAQFDSPPGWGGDDQQQQVVNPDFSPQDGTLYERGKGRGIGDCGLSNSYAWDGTMFRLSERREMTECRGVWDWPRIWVADVSVVH